MSALEPKHSFVASKRCSDALTVVFIVLVAAVLAWLSTRFSTSFDWTANNRNSLTEPSVRQLAAMKDPIKVTAWVTPDKEIRRNLTDKFLPYQQHKSNLTLEFIDPLKQPAKARELNVGASGVVFIEYQSRRESLTALSEQTITTALQRLTYAGERWVVFLKGHGERSLEDANQAGLEQFAKLLQEKGLKAQGVNLAATPNIPQNTAALVIASPQSSLLPGEVKLIQDHVNAGGNLLWMADPGSLAGLEPLAKTLQVNWLNGTLIYPDYEILGTQNPAIALVMQYSDHPINYAQSEITVFPFARGLKGVKDSLWHQQPILTTPDRSWSETGKLDGDLTFNTSDGDVLGPFMIGLAMDRVSPTEASKPTPLTPKGLAEAEKENAKKVHQRVVVVGDSDFLSNAYLGMLGNQQLGLNIVQWIANRDEQISIDVPKAPDNKLFLAPWAPMVYGLVFVLGLPLIFVTIGVSRWYLRRRR